MPHPEMRIYTAYNGVESIGRWRNERVFEAVKNYLVKIGARVSSVHENNKPKDAVFVYLETKEQSDALDEFVKSLGRENQA